MSEASPLTVGGFALPPTPPDAPASDDDWLLRDFLAARALAPHLDIIARLDAFAAAHGAADDPSANTLCADVRTQSKTLVKLRKTAKVGVLDCAPLCAYIPQLFVEWMGE